MNIEKGMYIRTTDGIIAGVNENAKYNDEYVYIDRCVNYIYEADTTKIRTPYIKEVSKNLIDLIECGDWLYTEMSCCLETSGILKSVVIVDYDYLRRLKEDKEMQSWIKSIITKEQIEQHSLKVGE